MFTRIIKYNRPDESTAWPWTTSVGNVVSEAIAFENYILASPTVGLVTRFTEETNNAYTLTLVFESEDAFNAYISTDEYLSMIIVVEENMVTRNITKTVSTVSD